MAKLEELLSELKKYDQIKRAEKLKQIILEHPEYLDRFQRILSIQKEIVRLEYSSGTKQTEAKKAYEMELEKLLEEPVISEYLQTLEEVNNLVQNIVSLFNELLNNENAE